MVKGFKNTNYRRNYWKRRKYMFYKAIKNYHYVKLSTTDLIDYSGNKIIFVSNNGNFNTIQDILAACPDFRIYRDLYISMQIRGIAVQITPCCNVSGFVGGTAFLALLAENENPSVATCSDSDHSLVLNPAQFCSMYWKTGYPWSNSNDASESYGKLGLAINQNAQQGGFRWTVKFIFYVLYKTAS